MKDIKDLVPFCVPKTGLTLEQGNELYEKFIKCGALDDEGFSSYWDYFGCNTDYHTINWDGISKYDLIEYDDSTVTVVPFSEIDTFLGLHEDTTETTSTAPQEELQQDSSTCKGESQNASTCDTDVYEGQERVVIHSQEELDMLTEFYCKNVVNHHGIFCNPLGIFPIVCYCGTGFNAWGGWGWDKQPSIRSTDITLEEFFDKYKKFVPEAYAEKITKPEELNDLHQQKVFTTKDDTDIFTAIKTIAKETDIEITFCTNGDITLTDTTGERYTVQTKEDFNKVFAAQQLLDNYLEK